MKKIMRALLSIAVAGAMPSAPALADFNDKKPITATVTGATPTGYPRQMVEGLNAIVRDTYPDSAVSFKPNSPGGGVVAIAKREADFTATATGTEIRLANEGTKPFEESLKGKFSFAMFLYDTQFMHLIMTKAWADSNGIKTWQDIAAKKPKMRLAINRIDNPQTTIGGPYEIMKAHGFTYEDIQKWGGSYVLGNSSIGLDALLDGKADVFLNVRNLGDPLVKDIAGKRELLWIDGDRATIQKAADVFNFKAAMLPAGTYPFMDKDYPTIQQWVALLVGTHVADEVVYKYVKALAEGEAKVREIGGSVRNFKASEMATNPANLEIHPGALRYYKEKGLVK